MAAQKKTRKRSRPPITVSKIKPSITGKTAFELSSLTSSKSPGIKSKHTRKIIRTHHNLLKRQSFLRRQLKEELSKNTESQSATLISQLQKDLDDIDDQISKNGGIHEYQRASIAGQDVTRGGDTSKLLVTWLNELGIVPTKSRSITRKSENLQNENSKSDKNFSLLEIGSLSAKNACSTCNIFDYVERIDLNSQDPENIKEQDFMKRPLPTGKDSKEYFDLISLSLVVNYVSDPYVRGKMLLKTTQFLKIPSKPPKKSSSKGLPFPCLFLVLPAPCVTNSRYLNNERITEIMNLIGYTTVLKHKVTNKLAYWLWKYDIENLGTSGHALNNNKLIKIKNIMEEELRYETENPHTKNDEISTQMENSRNDIKKIFPKVEVNPGGGRNNFAIVL